MEAPGHQEFAALAAMLEAVRCLMTIDFLDLSLFLNVKLKSLIEEWTLMSLLCY